MSDAKRAMRKLRAIARAERRLKHRLDDIDWEEETLKPALENLEALTASGDTPTFDFGGTEILKQLTGGDSESEA